MSLGKFPVNPPWPPPDNLADGVDLPHMEKRDLFVREVTLHFGDGEHSAIERWNAARHLISGGDLNGLDDRVETRALAAWLLTPREAFLPSDKRGAAYLPHALPIGHKQTISAPYMVSRMTAALNPGPHDRVLEIGTGSGYQAAMLAALSDQVRTIEYVGPLAAEAGRILETLAVRRPWLEKIRRRTGNGYEGWSDEAPFDRIIVTCAIDHLPPALTEQLAHGGILIIPLGGRNSQQLIALRRRKSEESGPPRGRWRPAERYPGFDFTDVYSDGSRVVFVPFVN